MDETMNMQSRAAPGHSCTACRRRKIRCDRQQPCGYCKRLRLECVYTIPSQDARKPPADDLLSRLTRIELSLKRIERNTNDTDASRVSDTRTPPTTENTTRIKHTDSEQLKKERGKLVLEEGDTRYVTSSFWTDLNEAEDDSTFDIDALTNEVGSTPSRRSQVGQHLLFGPTAAPVDIHQLHPAANRVFALWQVYIESVHPIFNLLHVPTIQRQLMRACQDLTRIPPSFESLMFSIYYAAVTSMQSSVSCLTLDAEERQLLLERYRIGIEQSLATANFVCAPNVTTLQAFTLFLTCARQSVDKTFIWSMTGLLIRLAMMLGLHRDPDHFDISPFPAEMRRRLWWQVLILDVRTAEENDSEPFICEHVFDTKFPANINDSDLDMNMTQSPMERQTRTEALFTLTRFEISYAARKLVFSPKFTTDNGYSCLSVEQKNEAIDTLFNDLNKKYLQYCDDKVPICFLTRTASQKLLAKMKLTINHPSRTKTIGIPRDRLNCLVQSAVDIVQYAHELRSNEKYSRWIWLFQKYIEWDAVAFLLHTMSSVLLPNVIERSWDVVNVFFDDWSEQIPEGEQRWQRLISLRIRAAAKQGICFLTPDIARVDPLNVISTEQTSQTSIYDSRQTQQVSQVAQQTTILNSDVPLERTNSVQQHNTLEELWSWPTDDLATWTFDNTSYSMQGAANWEMDLDEAAFMSPT